MRGGVDITMKLAEIYAEMTPEQRKKFNTLKTINELNAFIAEYKLDYAEQDAKKLIECIFLQIKPLLHLL